MESDVIKVNTNDVYDLCSAFNSAEQGLSEIKWDYVNIAIPEELEIQNYIGQMANITKFIKDEMVDNLEGLKQIAMNAVSEYELIDGEVNEETFMKWLNTELKDYEETSKLIEEIIGRLKDANLVNNNIDIDKLRQEMYDYIESNPNNRNTLEFWKNHIPDNFTEFINNYNWDSPVNFAYKKNGFTSFTEWFQVNGVDFRMTRMIDLNSDYANLMSLMNLTYCCEMINTIGTWDKDVMDILSKREYIDIFVPDFPSDCGAAFYMPKDEYLDYILLPTRMGSEHMYNHEGVYNYLRNCVVHEMGHYLDAICGVTHNNDLGISSDVYNLALFLINSHWYQIQLINHGGKLSSNDLKSILSYCVGKNNNSFCEGFAELMRANLVDHAAFVQIIGEENYNALFNGMQDMSHIHDYEVSVTIDDDKNVLLEFNRDKECRHYRNGLCQSIMKLDENGELIEQWDYLYDENHKKIQTIKKDSNENILEQREYSYDEDGRLREEVYRNVEYTEMKQYDNDGKILVEQNFDSDGSYSKKEYNYYENGNEQLYIAYYYGNITSQYEHSYYENGQKKSSREQSGGDRYRYDEWDENGNLKFSSNCYGEDYYWAKENLSKEDFEIEYPGYACKEWYYPNGKIKTIEYYNPDGSLKKVDNYDEQGNSIP